MILCIDAGATSCKWTVKDASGHFDSGKVPPVTGHIFDAHGYQNARDIFRRIRSNVGAVGAYKEIVLGVTGLDRDSDVSREISTIISEEFEIKFSDIRLMNDMELAYEAVLDNGRGILIYAGTGAIAVSIDQSGTFHRAGGWGFHVGDDGGGYSIGRSSLRHVTRLWDVGVNPLQDPLAAAVLSKAGATNWSELRNYIYGGGRSAIGELAVSVMEQGRAGSEPALQMMRDAGISLAILATAMRNRLNLNEFVAMGGAFRLHPVIIDTLSANLGTKVKYFDLDISHQWILRNR